MTYMQLLHRIVQEKRLRQDSGQALIETAVSVSFMVLILLGAVEFGRVAYASIEVSNAARAATQVACMNGGALQVSSGTYIPNYNLITTAAAADAAEIYAVTPGTFQVNSNVSCICSDGGATSCVPGACSKSFLLVTVNVNTQAQFDPLFHIPSITGTFTLNGHSSQQVLPQ